MQVVGIIPFSGSETLNLSAVGKPAYDKDGTDEDNSYAQWTPSADMRIHIANPALHGKFKVGDAFYIDFTPVQK